MIKLTEEEFDELLELCDGYTADLDEYETTSDKYHKIKNNLDNSFCGLSIWQEREIIHAELGLGNVIIENDILTCIYNNRIHKFKMVKRKANNGEYVYITTATEQNPFNIKYIGRCFKVDKQPTKEMLELVVDHVVVNIEDLDVGWCLYDDQYVVLEEIA